jgi:hypothetical protein
LRRFAKELSESFTGFVRLLARPRDEHRVRTVSREGAQFGYVLRRLRQTADKSQKR